MTDLLPHPATRELFPSPVPPGTGWPGDPATERTPVATTAAQVRRLARVGEGVDELAELDARVSVCRACPRLVRWREDVARDKRASFATEPYWGRPVPGWGTTDPSVLIVGLAPAANGANRTGRIFTGDRSGDWLFAGLHRVGLARTATSTHADDGQELIGTRMIATVRCAPPQNKPTVVERDTCAPWLLAELGLVLPTVEVVVALGTFGWDATLRSFAGLGWQASRPRPRFGHGVETRLVGPGREVTLLGCYHPSQQNTFTGRLTEVMLDDVLRRAAVLGRITG
ncbi:MULTISPECIES: uracil-DNA glycosylase [unclassified Nocardioides]|uniref:uracil-DNA glycosylase n=1 Tax=unclassified Nocardioides TaxID=2615069 RepID=UPI000057094A|nr:MULTISPECIES: uracil-DNA glycosylase [unclassified Nocardioides]ABL80458.1 Uracil-DNA glycosylase superfamily [Nocardioides sp. JS614]